MKEEVVMTNRTLEITYKLMVAAIEAQCVKGDKQGRSWYVVDAHGRHVQDVKDAPQTTSEAVEWLIQRGLAKLVKSVNGILIVLADLMTEAVPTGQAA